MNFAEAYEIHGYSQPPTLLWEPEKPAPLPIALTPEKLMHAFVDAEVGQPVLHQPKRLFTTDDLDGLTAMAAAAPSEPAYGALLHLVERHGSVVVSLRF